MNADFAPFPPKTGAAPSAAPPIGPDAPWLAPMAGFTDLPFRLLCRERGCVCAVTEMVSAKGLCYDSKGTTDLLATCPKDAPFVVQLFGSDEECLKMAMDMLLERGVAYFDLNAGCPAPKVVKTGAGAALLKKPGLLARLAAVMTERAGPGRTGVKIRLGMTPQTPVYLELAKSLEDAGAAWLTLHPRYASQGFSGRADLDALARFKKASALPVIASGDLFTAMDAARCLARTGADGVMFARGALYDPGVFSRFTALMRGDAAGAAPPTGPEIAGVIRRHAELARQYGSGRRSLLKMRTAAPRYLRDVPGSRLLRVRLCRCNSWEELEDIAAEVEAGRVADPVSALQGADGAEEAALADIREDPGQ